MIKFVIAHHRSSGRNHQVRDLQMTKMILGYYVEKYFAGNWRFD